MASNRDAKLLRQELVKRKLLRKLVIATIERDYVVMDGRYSRRGEINQSIADALSISVNNLLIKEVLLYMKGRGVESVTIHGKKYFKNLVSKQFLVGVKQ